MMALPLALREHKMAYRFSTGQLQVFVNGLVWTPEPCLPCSDESAWPSMHEAALAMHCIHGSIRKVKANPLTQRLELLTQHLDSDLSSPADIVTVDGGVFGLAHRLRDKCLTAYSFIYLFVAVHAAAWRCCLRKAEQCHSCNWSAVAHA